MQLEGYPEAVDVLLTLQELGDVERMVALASYATPLVFSIGFYVAVLKRRSEPIGVVAPVS